MAPTLSKKRKLEDGMKGKLTRPPKRFRKQQTYSSGSSSPSLSGDEFTPLDLADSDIESITSQSTHPTATNGTPHNKDAARASNASDSSSNSNSNSNSDSESSSSQKRTSKAPTKRHDPLAFSTSLQKILSTKLTASKRQDPVLARSKTALQASQELNEGKLEAKAKRTLRDEKRKEKERGRVKDVLLGDERGTTKKRVDKGGIGGGTEDGGAAAATQEVGTEEGGMTAAEIAEQERRLRKTAQRGVVKLFNAVRAAQVKAEEAARELQKRGVVGVGRREEKVSEMSKKGFLELVAGGGGVSNGGGKGGGTARVGGVAEA
ncbi:hypothetical protein MMC24_007288 [Lignoscripta atroalba]|nr:hypothetical protein [Lignoscripta atroalba]